MLKLDLFAPDWSAYATCKDLTKEKRDWFFAGAADPNDGEDRPAVMEQHEAARMICYGECPVQVECLRWCIESGSQFGIFGGLTPSQRKRYTEKYRRQSDDVTDVELAQVISRAGKRIVGRLTKQNS